MASANLPLRDLERELLDPNSECYLERILDLVTSLVKDCDYPSAKNSPTVQAFLKRYKKVADLIEAQRTKYSDFELIKVIGKGGFGRVELGRHRRTRRVYAIKTMSKQHLLDRSHSGYWEERDVMVKASSEWLVACHHAFLDKDNVYLCMEYLPGGDLYHWLDKCDTLDENTTRFYLAETILALETLHNMHFIHRDLKPENMLLDASGHLKLADFGSCVRIDSEGYHLCAFPIGTPDYISPEMLACNSQAKRIGPECDWWSVGVIAYEMVYANPPFYGSSLVETYSHILAHDKYLSFPTDVDSISVEFQNLVKSFLQPAETRLGSLTAARANNPNVSDLNKILAITFEQVKSHPFFKDIVWSQVRSQDPPFRPEVKSEVDTSYVDFDEENSEAGSSELSKLPHSNSALSPSSKPPAYFTGNHLSFAGYTFNRDHVYLQGGLRLGDAMNETLTGSPARSKDPSQAEFKQKYEAAQSELNKLRQAVESLEKQAAIGQVTIKEVQRRLNESTLELDKAKRTTAEYEKTSGDLRAKLSALQAERDAIDSELAHVRSQLKTLTENLEAERNRVLDLDNEKTAIASELEQTQFRLQETETQLQEQLRIEDTLKNLQEKSEKSQDAERIASLEESVKRLQSENRQAREKTTLLMSEASTLNRNHTRQVNELTSQLQEADRLCKVYQTKCEMLNRSLETSTANEELLQKELASLRVDLDQAISSRRDAEDRLVSTESELVTTRVELRAFKESSHVEIKETQSQLRNATQMAQQRLVELDNVSAQLDDMRLRCTEAEHDRDHLTNLVTKLQKERDEKQQKVDLAVEKLLRVQNEKDTGGMLRKRGREQNIAAHEQLVRDYKNLQSSKEKLRADLQLTIDQYKRDLSESKNTVAMLTEDCCKKDEQLAELRSLVQKLYNRIDQLAPTHSTPLKSREVLPSGDTSTSEAVSITRSSSTASTATAQTELARLTVHHMEAIVDLDGKGKGRKKLIWMPKFAQLKPFVLSFYTSQKDKEMGSPPVEEIVLHRVIHVRQATSADLIHAQRDDLQRTIQMFFQTDESSPPMPSSAEVSEADLNATTVSLITLPGLPNGGQGDSHLRWLDHKFQPMQFRFTTVLCEVCNRPCSDLRSPPPALECVKCRMRIHLEHVQQHEKFAACNSAAQVRYIRLPNVADMHAWLAYFRELLLTLRQMQQNPEMSSMIAGLCGTTQPTMRLSVSSARSAHKRSSVFLSK